MRRRGQMLLIPIEACSDRANGRIAGQDAIKISSKALGFYKGFTTTIRAPCEVRTRLPSVEIIRDRLRGTCGNMNSSK